MFKQVLIVMVAALMTLGCTHDQLRRNSLGQASSLAELHEQQVLDNIARFVHNPETIPYFALPGNALNEMNDKGSFVNNGLFKRAGFGFFPLESNGLNSTLERTAKENWILTPVNDPRKLELMRCAYRNAVNAHVRCVDDVEGLADDCPDCVARWKKFYGTNKDGSISSGGRVTITCANSQVPWFHWGNKHDVPKHERCLLVAEHCGVYVWVCPQGRAELTKLTLMMLDFALNPFPSTPTKNVVIYLDSNYNPTFPDNASMVVSGTIAVSDPIQSILQGDQSRIRGATESRQKALDEEIPSPTPLPPRESDRSRDLQELNQLLQQLR
jgi:hypothetical protein